MTKFRFSIGQSALYMTFIIMVICFTSILLKAFFDHQNINEEILHFLMEKKRFQVDSLGIVKIDPEFDSSLDKLEFKTEKMLEGNTVNFLFQIFTIALISIGVFLLEKVNSKQEKINLLIDNWGNLLNSNQVTLSISNYLSKGVSDSNHLRLHPDKSAFIVPTIRESLTSVNQILNSPREGKILIENNYKELLIGMLSDIKDNLSYLNQEEKYANILNEAESLIVYLGDNNNFVKIVSSDMSKAATNNL